MLESNSSTPFFVFKEENIMERNPKVSENDNANVEQSEDAPEILYVEKAGAIETADYAQVDVTFVMSDQDDITLRITAEEAADLAKRLAVIAQQSGEEEEESPTWPFGPWEG